MIWNEETLPGATATAVPTSSSAAPASFASVSSLEAPDTLPPKPDPTTSQSKS